MVKCSFQRGLLNVGANGELLAVINKLQDCLITVWLLFGVKIQVLLDSLNIEDQFFFLSRQIGILPDHLISLICLNL